jgi:hypothetical protein
MSGIGRRDSAAIGKAPAGATHWSVRRKGPFTWDWCTHVSPEGEATQEFPVAELSLPTIRKRWGPGIYRVMFLSIARGARKVLGDGKTFALPEAEERSATLRSAQAARASDAEPPPAQEDHAYIVRALLRAAEGKHRPDELFEALAVPLGMALSSLFTLQDRNSERLDAIERRLGQVENRLGIVRPIEEEASPVLGRILDKLQAIEGRLGPPAGGRREGAATPRKDSPGERRRRPSG